MLRRRICLVLLLSFICWTLYAKAAWTQQAYVWQRQWTPQVIESLKTAEPQLDGIQILAGEINWRQEPQAFLTQYDASLLSRQQSSLTLVLRISSYPGPFSQDDPATKYILRQTDQLLQCAIKDDVPVTALQIDFDCAESKLDGYREWLLAIRNLLDRKYPSVALSFTALPAWLRHQDDFRKLAEVADSFVLQVHSLEKPESPDSAIELCNPKESMQWASQAAKIGKPFLLALPTYGYELIFDQNDSFTALVAEGKRPQWAEGTQVRIIRSDPTLMAELAQTLSADPPENCQGIVWFRLPIATDRLNWSMDTFRQVIGGSIPKPGLTCHAKLNATDPNLVQIVLTNSGDTRMAFPKTVSASWDKQKTAIAWDSTGVFSISVNAPEQSATIDCSTLSPSANLLPGQSTTLAWIRFNQPTTLSVNTHDT